ncbi:MAG TPA: Ig-like domain-containing protein [Longimicrobiales bacterium]
MEKWQIRTVALAFVVWAPVACADGPQEPEGGFVVEIAPQADTLNAIGDTVRLVATVADAAGDPVSGASVEWTSLDGGVATVDGDGRVIGLAEGVARIRARHEDAADTAEVLVRAGVPDGEMQFVRFSSAVLDRVATEGSFWAVRGEDRELILRYAPDSGEPEGEAFLRFRVSAESLWKRPDGTTFAEGDSVRITVAVDAETGFLFRFEPSGLRFDPEHPARLRVEYREAEDDFDGDGGIDDDDRELEETLAVWRQEQPGDPWVRLFTLKDVELDELEAEVGGFTGFALATN